MAILLPGQAWPIVPWDFAYRVWAENDAWLTGDTDALQRLYGAAASTDRPTHRTSDGVLRSGGLLGTIASATRSTFWGKPVPEGETRKRLHVPAAADVATLSSDLLFAEPPTITYADDASDASDDTIAASKLTQARLDLIMSSDPAHAWMAESGEYASAFGATALTAVWDDETADHVWVRPTAADVTIPEFRYGRLIALNLWDQYVDGSTYYRHVERHEPGYIFHTLYQGTAQNLGRVVPLGDRPETAGFKVDSNGGNPTGTQTLTAAWWLNVPARAWRKRGVLAEAGRSDFSGGTKGLFDALDETWSSWMRDIELGKARLIVPSAFLESYGRGDGAGFDTDRQLYSGLEVPGDASAGMSQSIEQVQFKIRVAEHEQTAQALFRRILASAGYGELDKESDQSSGAKTATEVTVGSQSKERTRDRKALYAKQALAQIGQAAMELDGIKFPGKGGGKFAPPTVIFPPASQVDPFKNAQTIQALRGAGALSVETSVRWALQPTNASESEIQEEIARVQAEKDASSLADPTKVGNPIDDEDARRKLGLDENGDPLPPTPPAA